MSRSTGDHVGVGEQEARELDVGDHAEHRGLGERPVELAQRAGAVDSVGDDLRQHRVVVAADHGALLQPGVDADAGTGRFDEIEHLAAGGQEFARGIFGVDAGLDGVTGQGDVRPA